MKTQTAGFSVLLFCAGCSSSPTEPAVQGMNGAGNVAVAPASAAENPQGKAYFHNPAQSGFALGALQGQEPWRLGQKLVGTAGVLATTETGATFGVLNADVHHRKLEVGPLTHDPAEHTRRVVDYFVSRGLPADQIGEPGILTLMSKEGTSFDSPSAKEGKLLAYTTVLHRTIRGIRVGSSYAAASFNADGEVTAESVYWPEIPRAVILEAIAAKDELSSKAVHDALKSTLGASADYEDGEIMINHAAATEPFSTHVSIDFRPHVSPQGGTAAGSTRHLRLDGTEIVSSPEQNPNEIPKGVQFR